MHELKIGNRQSPIGNALARICHCLSTLLEHFAVPDETGARVGGEFEVLRQL